MAVPAATRLVAQFAHRMRYENLPQAVVDRAKDLILDQLGVEIAASTLPWNKLIYDYAKGVGAKGRSTIVNYGFKTHPEYASFANGTFGHGFEIDDYHSQALNHPGCVAVPSAIAIAEEYGLGGKDVILAVVIGSEIIVRMGLSSGESMLVDRGFHETCVQGTIGCAPAVGRMLNLDENTIVNALGIAGSHSSGTIEYAQTGGDVKRIHAGLGCMGGIRSVTLAKMGYTGPPTILEGKRGIFQAIAARYDLEKFVDRLGEDWSAFLGVCFKPYCNCGLIHSQIDGVKRILKEYKVKPEEIEEIVVGADRLSMSHVGTVGPRPKDITGAQFSTHYSLGMTVVKGRNDFNAYQEAMKANFQEPEIIRVAERVKMVLDEEVDKAFPRRMMARVSIKARGQNYTELVEWAKGTPGNPMTRDDLVEKFTSLATVVLPENRAARLRDTVLALEKISDISKLTNLLVV